MASSKVIIVTIKNELDKAKIRDYKIVKKVASF
jgi:hypothetical protein